MRPGTLGLTRRGVRPPSVGEALSVEPPREQRVLREAPGGRNEEDASLPSRTRWDPRVPHSRSPQTGARCCHRRHHGRLQSPSAESWPATSL